MGRGKKRRTNGRDVEGMKESRALKMVNDGGRGKKGPEIEKEDNSSNNNVRL